MQRRAGWAAAAVFFFAGAVLAQRAKPGAPVLDAGGLVGSVVDGAVDLTPSVGPVLSVLTQPVGWRVVVDDVPRGASVLLFLGYPNPYSTTSQISLGIYGSLELAIAYSGVALAMPVRAHLTSADLFFARPDPMPLELIGLVIELQAVTATPVEGQSAQSQPASQLFDFLLTAPVSIKLQ